MPKAKISVTVDEALLERINRLAPESTRSEIVEVALERWARDTRRQILEKEIEQYYLELSSEDKAEDQDWAEMSASSLRETWK